MIRTLLAAAALFVAAGSSRADTLPLVGVPSGYYPGQAFSFDVFAPGLVGLTDYTLQFSVTAGAPPTLPDLTVNAALPAAGFPFPDSEFKTSQFTLPDVNSYFVKIEDRTLLATGVDTVLGVNDRLATITISPGVNLSGPIVIAFTQNEFTTGRDVSFDLPSPIIIPPNENPDTPPGAVPAPPGVVLLGIGGLCFLARSRFRRPV